MLANWYELCGWLVVFLRKIGYLHSKTSGIGYELCSWPVAFLRHMELDMSYEAGY